MISSKEFEEAVGEVPRNDDLIRVNCKKAGEPGHLQCGWCPDHDKPRFFCGCYYRKK